MRVALISAAATSSLASSARRYTGIYGSVEGTACATWVGATLCWWQLRVAVREYKTSPAPRAAADDAVRAFEVAQGQTNV